MKDFNNDSFQIPPPPLQYLSAVKLKESVPSLTMSSPNPLNSSIHQPSNHLLTKPLEHLTKIFTNSNTKFQKYFLDSLRSPYTPPTPKLIPQEPTSVNQSILKGASHAFNLVFKQIQKKLVMNSFNEIHKY